MTEIIFNAVITGTFSILGIIISGLITSSLVKYRVEQLEKKVEKHNNMVERIYKMEQKVEDLEREGH